MNHERTRIDITERVDEADHPPCAAQVQSRESLSEGVQVEEGVTGEDIFAMAHQPVIDRSLLGGGDPVNLNAGDRIKQTQSAVVLEKLIGQFLYSKASEGGGDKK